MLSAACLERLLLFKAILAGWSVTGERPTKIGGGKRLKLSFCGGMVGSNDEPFFGVSKSCGDSHRLASGVLSSSALGSKDGEQTWSALDSSGFTGLLGVLETVTTVLLASKAETGAKKRLEATRLF